MNRRKSGQHPASFVQTEGPVPAPSPADGGATLLSSLSSASPPDTAVSSLTVAQPDWQNIIHWHRKWAELPKPSDPHLPSSVKYRDLQPRTLWAPQHRGLPSPLLLLPFQATFSNQTPTKTILHKLQQTFLKIPHKPYRNPAADFWLSTEPLYINTRENTLARH